MFLGEYIYMGIRRIAKREFKSGNAITGRVVRREAILHNRSPLMDKLSPIMCDEKFVELFNLFRVAVDHEIGNSFGGLKHLALRRMIEGKGPDLMKKVENTEGIFHRITTLAHLAKGTSFPNLHHLSVFRKKFLKIKKQDGKYTADIRAIRKYALADVRKFRKSLEEFESMGLELSEKAKRVFVFGRLLCNSLEKLFLGNLDLDAELIPMKMGGKTSSVKADITEVRKMSRCTISFQYQTEGVRQAKVLVNPVFLTLIAKNLISNSERAMEIKELEPHVRVDIISRNGSIILEFSDEGCGMTEDIMEKINSGEEVTTKKGKGYHGLGFQYCRKLAEKMGGRLYVSESIVGEGTTVALELKIAE